MWNYFRKYKSNYAKNSVPPETRSNASSDVRIWESGPVTLNPLNWHCYRFVLGHHLFNHKLSRAGPKTREDRGPFFLSSLGFDSELSKTQPNHWTKQMTNTRLTT